MRLDHYWRAGLNALFPSPDDLCGRRHADPSPVFRADDVLQRSTHQPQLSRITGSQDGLLQLLQLQLLLHTSALLLQLLQPPLKTTHLLLKKHNTDSTTSSEGIQFHADSPSLCSYFSDDHIFLFTWSLCFSSNSCSRVRTLLWVLPDSWSSLDSPFCLIDKN